MKNNTINQGTPKTFFRMIQEYCIRIPSMQRSYAQGRNTSTAKEIRGPFIADLKSALRENKAITLDNIYGQIDPKDNAYIPLDGQQRLTTLFLLHVYLLKHAESTPETNELKKVLCNKEQHRFSYATRKSSEDFCQYLLECDFSNNDSTPQEQIKNDMDYQWNWDYDPTIASMLNMLDTIHEIFYGECENKEAYANYCAECCKKLVLTDCISFFEQNIENTLPNDELYIRMNARGLALTSFENFKASLLNFLKGNGDEEISKKLDTSWATALWQFVLQGNNNIGDRVAEEVDSCALKMLQSAIMSWIYEQEFKESDIKDKIQDINDCFSVKPEVLKRFSFYNLQHRGGLPDSMAPEARSEVAKRICYLFKKLVSKLENDWTLSDDPLLKGRLLANWEGIDNSENTQKTTWSYAKTLEFYAEYFYEYFLDKEPSVEWKRLIKHLIEHSDIRDSRAFYNAHRTIFRLFCRLKETKKEIEELIRENTDAEKFKALFTSDGINSGFNNTQIFEEGLKILLKVSDEWKNAIEKAENEPFFSNQILFIFECVLPDNMIQSSDIYSCSRLLDENKIEIFNRYRDDLQEIFADKQLPFLLRRAMLSTDLNNRADHEFPNYPFTPEYIKAYQAAPNVYHTNKSGFVHRSEWQRILRLDVNKSAQDKPEYRALIRQTVRGIALAGRTGSCTDRLWAYSNEQIAQIDPAKLLGKDVYTMLKHFAVLDSWEKYQTFLCGARLHDHGQIVFLAGQGQRLDKKYMELHIILLFHNWQLPHGLAFDNNGLTDLGMLTIKRGETKYKFKYENGNILKVDGSFVCNYNIDDLETVRKAVIDSLVFDPDINTDK